MAKRPNLCIIGDAILPQSDKKITKNAVRNLAVCCGAIWRRREKPQYRCSTTFLHVHNSPKDVLENFLPVWPLFGTHKVVHSERFLDYRYEIWQLLSALYNDVRKKNYTGAHLRSGPKQLQWNFSQISELSIRSRAHKLPHRFLDFSKFLNTISPKDCGAI